MLDESMMLYMYKAFNSVGCPMSGSGCTHVLVSYMHVTTFCQGLQHVALWGNNKK